MATKKKAVKAPAKKSTAKAVKSPAKKPAVKNKTKYVYTWGAGKAAE